MPGRTEYEGNGLASAISETVWLGQVLPVESNYRNATVASEESGAGELVHDLQIVKKIKSENRVGSMREKTRESEIN